MARNEFRSKDKRKLPIFIHSELDDYGLTCVEFRVYARIARRAGGENRATESAPNMAEAFGVDVSTVRRALKVLCLCGLVSKKDRPGWTPEYTLEEQDKWRDSSELKAVRESVLHPPKHGVTLVTTHRGKPEADSHQTPETLVTTPTTPSSPDIDEGTPVKVLQEGTPIMRACAREVPRSKTLDPPIDPPYRGEAFLDALSQFEAAQKELRCPVGPTRRKALYDKLGVWGEKIATFELLRAVEHGWRGVFREAQNGNGNGHKPVDDYRGPGRNTESDAARKKREACPDCNGTNNRLIPVIDERSGREIQVSAICKHENSIG